jgi:hypothetical protein
LLPESRLRFGDRDRCRRDWCNQSQIRLVLAKRAAKELLRHSSVSVTAAHYVENRKRGRTGLGALLNGSDKKVIAL